MQQFSYKNQVSTSATVVDRMNKKINRQRVIFSIFFVLVILEAFSYIFYNKAIETYEGYVVCRNGEIRMPEDISLVEYFVEPGDIVNGGDTLFSYIVSSWIDNMYNPNVLLDPIKYSRDADIKIAQLNSSLISLKNSADSLVTQINTLKKEVKVGVSTRDALEAKEWSYFQIRDQIRHTKRLIEVEEENKRNVSKYMPNTLETSPNEDFTYQNIISKKESFGKAFKYQLALTDMQVVSLNGKPGTLVYKKEPIVTFYPYNDPRLSDLHMLLLLPPNSLDKFQDRATLKGFVGDVHIGDGRVMITTTHVKEVDPQKISIFSQGKEAVVIRLEIINPEKFPQEYQIDNLPIKLQYDRWREWTWFDWFIKK